MRTPFGCVFKSRGGFPYTNSLARAVFPNTLPREPGVYYDLWKNPGWILKTNEYYSFYEHITERYYHCCQEGSLDLVIWVTGGGLDQSPLVEKVLEMI